MVVRTLPLFKENYFKDFHGRKYLYFLNNFFQGAPIKNYGFFKFQGFIPKNYGFVSQNCFKRLLVKNRGENC